MNHSSLTSIEPMLPSESSIPDELHQSALELIAKAERLKSRYHPLLEKGIGGLVRSMNCYYSNFIEGHNTHPYDIERALKQEFATDIKQRNLQLEAKAHIELQKKIDLEPIKFTVTSSEFILWLHREFCQELPDEMLWAENRSTKERKKIIPGSYRNTEVIVGHHCPVVSTLVPDFMDVFAERYDPNRFRMPQSIIAAAAAHHRLLWIHPFIDGNGRVTRLFSHAYLNQIGIGSPLWSISRGLARHHLEYKALLMAADQPRQGNYDGRGSLTEKGLLNFCQFFVTICIDQIDFMNKLLEPTELLVRIERWTNNQVSEKKLPKGATNLIKEAFVKGSFPRGAACAITGYKERQARTILSTLIEQELLVSDTPKSPVRLGFPAKILEAWFPSLYLGK